MSILPTIDDLLQAGAHFGHQTQRWNPKMKPYILTEKSGIYVINLELTVRLLEQAGQAAKRITAKSGTVLFVGTKVTARKSVQEAAEKCGHFFVTNRWLGGMLTNFQTVRKSIAQIEKIEEMEKNGLFKQMQKKEVLDLNRKREKLEMVFGGIRQMKSVPSLLVVSDINHEHIAVAEARRLNIPILAICDTNVNPELVNYPIPANDDAVKSVKIIMDYIAENVVPRSTISSNVQPQEMVDKMEEVEVK